MECMIRQQHPLADTPRLGHTCVRSYPDDHPGEASMITRRTFTTLLAGMAGVVAAPRLP